MNPNVDSRSSTAAPPSAPPSPPLQRGKACLSCRRRKMKCDGLRPICTPCLRGERADDCEYTDGQHRSRTMTLEEDVARLRARVQELEHPEEASAPVELHAPYASTSRSTPQPAPASYHHTGPMRRASSHGASSVGAADPRRADVEAGVHARRALSVIAPYATELGFFLNIDRLRVQGAHVSPALQSALTLWSAHITSMSGPDPAQSLERIQTLTSNLLSQAQAQLASALSTVDAEPDPAICLHVIQTGVLLAYYMQRIGQLLGARYHASGTWAMAMMLKLHETPHSSTGVGQAAGQSLRTGDVREGSTHADSKLCPLSFPGYAKLTPPLDGIEAEERVRAFWAVYALDRLFGVTGQGPCQPLPMEGNAMTVPWPGIGGMNEGRNVIQHLLNDPNHDFAREGPLAMHAKASVLLGEAAAVAALYATDHSVSQSPAFRTRFGTLDALLQRCFNVAMAMATGRPSQTQELTQVLMTVHLIAFAHVILHRPFISTYGPSQKRCTDVAFGVVRVLDRMGETSVRQSLIYAIAWTAMCVVLHDEVLRLRARPDADPARRREQGEMVAAIGKMVRKLSACSQRCPNRFFAAKIEAVLSILESIAV